MLNKREIVIWVSVFILTSIILIVTMYVWISNKKSEYSWTMELMVESAAKLVQDKEEDCKKQVSMLQKANYKLESDKNDLRKASEDIRNDNNVYKKYIMQIWREKSRKIKEKIENRNFKKFESFFNEDWNLVEFWNEEEINAIIESITTDSIIYNSWKKWVIHITWNLNSNSLQDLNRLNESTSFDYTIKLNSIWNSWVSNFITTLSEVEPKKSFSRIISYISSWDFLTELDNWMMMCPWLDSIDFDKQCYFKILEILEEKFNLDNKEFQIKYLINSKKLVHNINLAEIHIDKKWEKQTFLLDNYWVENAINFLKDK